MTRHNIAVAAIDFLAVGIGLALAVPFFMVLAAPFVAAL